MKKGLLTIIFAILFALVCSGQLFAYQICYVNDVIGDDSWDGSSPTYLWTPRGPRGPKKTIMAGVVEVNCGGTVIVADGTYSGPGNIEIMPCCITLQSENGPNNCIIDCQNLARAFEIDNCSEGATIIDGFTVINGYTDGSGGGIFINDSSNVIIRNCIIKYCWSERDYAGGIYISGDDSSDDNIEINNCRIEHNVARYGGGLFIMSGNILLIDCEITDNFAYEWGGNGGGIFAVYGVLNIENCIISDNLSEGDGAGMYIVALTPKVSNSVISNNRIYSEFDSRGGGIFFRSECIAEFSNCSIINNFAPGDGGGIYSSGDSITLYDCEISSNISGDGGGGGIGFEDGNLILESCKVKENSASGSHASGGGGINCDGGSLLITDSAIEENTANYGGGIMSVNNDLVLKSCKVKGNSANGSNEGGGGIFFYGGSLQVTDSIISENTGYNGGGINIAAYPENEIAVISRTQFRNNRAEFFGSGISIADGLAYSITNCVISGNMSGYRGGGIYVGDNDNVTNKILNCTIVGNIGSGIGTHGQSCDIEVKNCIIRQNIPNQFSSVSADMDVNYCNIEGGWYFSGADIIDVFPDFSRDGFWIVPEEEYMWEDYEWVDGDYHLKSTGGRYVEEAHGWALDEISSACIDVGDPNDNFETEGAHNGGRINMGAYGGTEFASKSGYCEKFPPGDLNGDCKTDFVDMAILSSGWLDCNRELEEECW